MHHERQIAQEGEEDGLFDRKVRGQIDPQEIGAVTLDEHAGGDADGIPEQEERRRDEDRGDRAPAAALGRSGCRSQDEAKACIQRDDPAQRHQEDEQIGAGHLRRRLGRGRRPVLPRHRSVLAGGPLRRLHEVS